MSERDENNRKIAEFLNRSLTDPIAKYNWRQIKEDFEDQSPDFYTDEQASAMLLDAMPEPALSKNIDHGFEPTHWWCDYDTMDSKAGPVKDPDRKTAVANAMLAFIQSQSKKD